MIKNQNYKLKKLKMKLSSLILLLFFLVVASFIAYNGSWVNKIALALSSNYNKTSGQQLTTADWNNLPVDFVARSGGASSNMSGQLDMNNNKVINLGTPTVNTDAASKQYVDNTIISTGNGGSVFVNWGQAVCPSSATLLYSGYAFNNLYSQSGGGSEPSCIQSGNAGAAAPNEADGLYPLGTGDAQYLPPGIGTYKEIKCAVCYKNGSCFTKWGDNTCPSTNGFSLMYSGYALGGHNTHNQKVDRQCFDNNNFDSSVNNNSWGAIMDGTMIWSNADIGLYSTNSYLRCAVCCN